MLSVPQVDRATVYEGYVRVPFSIARRRRRFVEVSLDKMAITVLDKGEGASKLVLVTQDTFCFNLTLSLKQKPSHNNHSFILKI